MKESTGRRRPASTPRRSPRGRPDRTCRHRWVTSGALMIAVQPCRTPHLRSRRSPSRSSLYEQSIVSCRRRIGRPQRTRAARFHPPPRSSTPPRSRGATIPDAERERFVPIDGVMGRCSFAPALGPILQRGAVPVQLCASAAESAGRLSFHAPATPGRWGRSDFCRPRGNHVLRIRGHESPESADGDLVLVEPEVAQCRRIRLREVLPSEARINAVVAPVKRASRNERTRAARLVPGGAARGREALAARRCRTAVGSTARRCAAAERARRPGAAALADARAALDRSCDTALVRAIRRRLAVGARTGAGRAAAATVARAAPGSLTTGIARTATADLPIAEQRRAPP